MNHEEQADKMEQFDIRNVHGHFEGKKITYIFFSGHYTLGFN